MTRPGLHLASGLFVAMMALVGFAAVEVAVAPTDAAAQAGDEAPVDDNPGLGKIIGSPEPGPDPEDPGDRGGWAQLGLAAILLFAVVFIGSRIAAGLRRAGP